MQAPSAAVMRAARRGLARPAATLLGHALTRTVAEASAVRVSARASSHLARPAGHSVAARIAAVSATQRGSSASFTVPTPVASDPATGRRSLHTEATPGNSSGDGQPGALKAASAQSGHTGASEPPQYPVFSADGEADADPYGEQAGQASSFWKDWNVDKGMEEVLNLGLEGRGPVSGSRDLAASYLRDKQYKTTPERVEALIRNESLKGFGSGFVTGVGGILMLPVGLPAAIVSSWVLQARLAGAVAQLYGHSVDDPHIRSLTLLSLLSPTSGAMAAPKTGGPADDTAVADATGSKVVREFLSLRAPLAAVATVQRAVGMRLAKHVAARGTARTVPLLGGLLGGVMDTHSMFQVGNTADRLFAKEALRVLQEAEAARAAAAGADAATGEAADKAASNGQWRQD